MECRSLIQLMISKVVLKKVTPFLLSVSVFSIIFSNSSWHCFFFRFLGFCFSSVPMQVFDHALDKSWIFLICNGILVVIAKTSGIVSSPSGFDLNDLLHKRIGDGLQAPPLTNDTSLEVSEPENAVPEVKGEEGEEGVGDNERLTEDQEENACSILVDDDRKEEEEEQEQEQESSEFFITTESGEDAAETQELQIACSNMGGDEEINETSSLMMEEDDDEEEEGMDKLSTEELNKKFDDFIRKMKEELRIELAQQQLVLVK